MTNWQMARHRVAIAGRVIDEETGKALSGADIKMLEMPLEFKQAIQRASMQYGQRWEAMTERLGKTRSRVDGLFYFMNLPSGDYVLQGSLASSGKRYGTGRETARVSLDADGQVRMTSLTLSLRPTTVRGKITSSGRESGVAMAEVRMKGSGERVFSNLQGQYVLAGIEPGERTIVVTAQGYQSAFQTVALKGAGAVENLNVVLAKEVSSSNFVQSGRARRGTAETGQS